MEHTFRGRVEVVADPVLKASILDCLRSATMVGRREIAGRISETLVIQTTQMEMHLILRRIGPAVEIYLDGVMYESNDLYGLLQKTWP